MVEIVEGGNVVHRYDNKESLAVALHAYFNETLKPQGFHSPLRTGNTILVDRDGLTLEFIARDRRPF